MTALRTGQDDRKSESQSGFAAVTLLDPAMERFIPCLVQRFSATC
jgi:hypothetical protein